jgi:hypothetical protein
VRCFVFGTFCSWNVFFVRRFVSGCLVLGCFVLECYVMGCFVLECFVGVPGQMRYSLSSQAIHTKC